MLEVACHFGKGAGPGRHLEHESTLSDTGLCFSLHMVFILLVGPSLRGDSKRITPKSYSSTVRIQAW